jgi:CPA2 family monovalent cation:H+ antiporter-2
LAEVGIDFIVDITLIMVVVGMAAILMPRLRYPPAIGYLIRGVILGAGLLPFLQLSNPGIVSFFGELGIILLMFSLGLEFNLKRLRKIGLYAAVAGTVEIAIMMAIGYTLGGLIGLNVIESFILGCVMAISSTALITKTLLDRGQLGSDQGSSAVGILIIQDFFVIMILAMISPFQGGDMMDMMAILEIVLRVILFITVSLSLGLVIVPRLMDRVCSNFKDESVLLVSLGLCFIMVLVSFALNLSVAIGAFVMGIIMSQSRNVERISSSVRPVNILFVAIFFVSMGMLMDPDFLIMSIPTAAMIATVFMIGMIFSIAFGSYLANRSAGSSLMTGLAMATMGEFSIIISKVALDSSIVGPEFYSAILTATLMTMLAYPLLQRRSDAILAWFRRHIPNSIRESLDSIECVRSASRARLSASRDKKRQVQSELEWIVIDVVVIITIVIGANVIYLLRDFLTASGIGEDLLAIMILVVTFIMIVPPIVSVVRRLRRIASMLTRWGLEPRVYGTKEAAIVEKAFSKIISAMGGLIILFMILPFFTFTEGLDIFILLLVMGLTGITIYLMWSTIHNMHSRICRAIRDGMSGRENDQE